jgi:WhiB family transcriptional regulator, redox-sensing transcriptional regulator
MNPTDSPASPAAWMQLGACRDAEPELFFPVSAVGPARDQMEQAKAICASCLVRLSCLSYALATAQDYGVWGGMGEEERREFRRARRLAGQAPAQLIPG